LRFIEKLGLYYENYGIPRIGGKLLGLLLMAGTSVSAEQMATALKISRSSVSTNIRLLVSFGFIEITPLPGERTDYFQISDTAWENAIKERIKGFQNLKTLVEEGLRTIDSKAGENQKLVEMLDWVNLLRNAHENALVEWINKK
jgi:DNA-binding transcriptional regulator GbsR (MarR family)